MGDDASTLWANSGDSHYMEPPHLYDELPAHLQELMPKTVQDEAAGVETITVDGQSFERPIPKPLTPERLTTMMPEPLDEDRDEPPDEARPRPRRTRPRRGPPARSTRSSASSTSTTRASGPRSIYPSLGVWAFNIRTPELAPEGCRISNDFFLEFQQHSPRYVVAASIPLVDVDDAVAEIRRAADLGFKLAFFPVRAADRSCPTWQHDEWEPVWAALEETGMVLGFHIGTEPHDPTGRIGVYHRGPGRRGAQLRGDHLRRPARGDAS